MTSVPAFQLQEDNGLKETGVAGRTSVLQLPAAEAGRWDPGTCRGSVKAWVCGDLKWIRNDEMTSNVSRAMPGAGQRGQGHHVKGS